MIPGMGTPLPSMTGGAAHGGTAGNKMGDWSGSAINMGGGSSNAPLYAVLGGFFVLAFTGFVIWATRRK